MHATDLFRVRGVLCSEFVGTKGVCGVEVTLYCNILKVCCSCAFNLKVTFEKLHV
jgi:hypothetical protein